MDRLEELGEGSVLEQVWLRAIFETEKLSHERLSEIKVDGLTSMPS